MMRKLVLALWLALFALPAFAATPVEEIDHLLGFISGSSCAATRSEMSGRLYEVRCGSDATIPAAEWLQAELAHYRKSAP